MPSMSGGALRHYRGHRNPARSSRFYALDVGRGFATSRLPRQDTPSTTVSMPSMSGGAWRQQLLSASAISGGRFYALDVGRGFATTIIQFTVLQEYLFLCPRCRAGL